MALSAGFPQQPKRPPASEPVVGSDGRLMPSWAAYFDALDRFNLAVRNFLNSQP
jgi:hypothetical protein